MERSEMLIYLNSSYHSSKSSVNNCAGLLDDSVIVNNNLHPVIKLKDFISDSGNENEVFNTKFANTSSNNNNI